ncbi:dienelactone hydrolase family protein [Zoogloea sp.]|uniref:dienelactone hydrolase family protein n=1 Tax=Zoogloea sp. TaxID=49181 RepID=UPI0031FD827E
MTRKHIPLLASLLALAIHANPAQAADDGRDCTRQAPISFVEMQTPNLVFNASGQIVANGLLTLKGKLRLPSDCRERHGQGRLPAVLILHGSSGVDARGDFHAEALNAAGFATLEVDMWEARGVGTGAARPALPALTYADAFTALRFLSARSDIDPARIGVLGFSWGAVISMAAATQNVATAVGGPLRFKAHAANYPICYAAWQYWTT